MNAALPVAVLGAVSGLTYGLLAIGLILVHRSSRVINFAQGAVGAVSAACLGVWVLDTGLPYWLLFPVALAVGATASMLTELVVVRRLQNAPAAMTIVATLGMGAFLTAVALSINTVIRSGSQYPMPPGLPSFELGDLVFTPAYVAQLIGSPLIALALAGFLRYSRYGIAIRAAADNPFTASASRISPARMSTAVWAVAGAVAAYAAIMQFPSQGLVAIEATSNSPGQLLRALLVAVLARMTSMVVALVAGVLLGVVEQLVLWYASSPGQMELVLFVALFAALLIQRRPSSRAREQGSWLALGAWPKPPERLARLWGVRNLGWIGAALLVAVLFLVLLTSHNNALVATTMLAFTLVGLSVFVVTGLLGQLSLGQFALAGVGAVLSYHLTSSGLDFALAFVLAGLGTAAAAAAIGCTALQIKGQMLTVTTLAFAVMAHVWLFQQPWAMPDDPPGRPIYFGTALDTSKLYLLFAIPVFFAGLWLTRNVNRGTVRRRLVALRDNEDGARAFAVPATRTKLQGFAVAGFLAGLGGALYGHSLPNLGHTNFGPGVSITVVAMSVIGGLSFMAGPLVGALYLIGLPHFVDLDAAGVATSTLGWLILILYVPGGLAQVIRPLRDRLIDLIGRRHGGAAADPAAAVIDDTAADESGAAIRAAAGGVAAVPPTSAPGERAIIEVRGLSKSFGAIHAVDDVGFAVREHEILGLIGPNGAGKTTVFEMIGGFTRPDRGAVLLDGRDVTALSPERRSRLGLVRSFQDARLFPTMTVLDVTMLALDRGAATSFTAAALAVPGLGAGERRRMARARELLHLMGLDRYRETPVAALSTGTRRVVELACVMAMEPTVVLLDEPSAGIAQRETEALGALITGLRDELGATIVVIEHDMPLITAVCDRVLAMDCGRTVTIGAPAEVVEHPEVVASYLGTDPAAVARSGTRVS